MLACGVMVSIQVSQSLVGWNVDRCMVWMSPGEVNIIQSNDVYTAKDVAITEMKGRAMKYIAERGRAETQEQVTWNTMSVDFEGTVMEEPALR
jgi:hypothetical protein